MSPCPPSRSFAAAVALLLVFVAGFPAAVMAAEISRQGLRDAAAYSASHRGVSLLVIQHGRTLLEEYPNGGGQCVAQKIFSGTKSFFTMATLAAEKDGLLSLDEPVSRSIPEWRDDPRRSRITVRQLMNFTDGLDPFFRLHGDLADRNALALRAPVVAAPGAAFIYGPSHGQVLCEVLRRKLAPRGLGVYAYVKLKVLDPLGIGDVPRRIDAIGNPLVASGFKLTARQWAAFGHLVLDGGRAGMHSVARAGEFEQCFIGTRANPMFGLGFWLNTGACSGGRETDIEDLLEKDWRQQNWHGRCISRSAPADMVAAVGSGYQRLFVIPSMDLIIVRQGSGGRFSDAEFLRLMLQ